jgi:predicted protein tyrosine phosphatase
VPFSEPLESEIGRNLESAKKKRKPNPRVMNIGLETINVEQKVMKNLERFNTND